MQFYDVSLEIDLKMSALFKSAAWTCQIRAIFVDFYAFDNPSFWVVAEMFAQHRKRWQRLSLRHVDLVERLTGPRSYSSLGQLLWGITVS